MIEKKFIYRFSKIVSIVFVLFFIGSFFIWQEVKKNEAKEYRSSDYLDVSIKKELILNELEDIFRYLIFFSNPNYKMINTSINTFERYFHLHENIYQIFLIDPDNVSKTAHIYSKKNSKYFYDQELFKKHDWDRFPLFIGPISTKFYNKKKSFFLHLAIKRKLMKNILVITYNMDKIFETLESIFIPNLGLGVIYDGHARSFYSYEDVSEDYYGWDFNRGVHEGEMLNKENFSYLDEYSKQFDIKNGYLTYENLFNFGDENNVIIVPRANEKLKIKGATLKVATITTQENIQSHMHNIFIKYLIFNIFIFLSVVLIIFYVQLLKFVRLKSRLVLEEEREKAIQNNKMVALGEMAAGISHEVKNPLTVILGFSKKLSKISEDNKVDLKKVEYYFKEIHKYGNKIKDIINGLNSIMRKSDHDPFVKTSISSIVKEVLILVVVKANNLFVSIENNISEEQNDITINCRPSQIGQVLLNLLTNSIDAIENNEEKWIKINLDVSDKEIVLSIIDSGNGISQEIQEKIFQSFFTTKKLGKGTGLGLGISKSIIEQHQGELYIDNECPNTKFCIKLPISHEESATPRAA